MSAFRFRFEPARASARNAVRVAARRLALARVEVARVAAGLAALHAEREAVRRATSLSQCALADLDRWSCAQAGKERAALAAEAGALAELKAADAAYADAARRSAGFERLRERRLRDFRAEETLREEREREESASSALPAPAALSGVATT